MLALDIFAIGFAGCFVAVSAHITFSSLYSCLFTSSTIVKARVVIGGLFLSTALANFVQYLPWTTYGCVVVTKLSIVSFHLQMMSGEGFQMYRISVISQNNPNGNRLFISSCILLLILRSLAMIFDFILSTSHAEDDQCVFEQEMYTGIVHLGLDAVIEFFITFAISMALYHHTREIKWLHRDSSSSDLYRIIIETNVFRTILLFLINVLTIFVIAADPNSPLLACLWSLMGIVYLYFVIYDKGMVRFLHQISKTSEPIQPTPSPPRPLTFDVWAQQYFDHTNRRIGPPLQTPTHAIIA
ncbi:hypothetical protein DSO57_1028530 [Entomophthora muscae]|uniref:Uncharacterized protein n=1 Tax=Entomophthora muscae TaxID=34485 RepID=A0ACC2TZK2_9FUNG|nr:hypothetical protein DSO57_1028530 [Entomophthora muscae]